MSPSSLPSGQLIVFGSIVQDLVSYVERFPRPGESVRGIEFKTSFGGKGANQAVMAAKLGAHVKMIGMVGNDVFADANINAIKSNGVDTKLIAKSATSSTGVGVIHVSADGENSIVVTLGANTELDAARAADAEADIAKASLIMCQSEVHQSGNIEAFKIAKRHGVRTFFNPAPGNAELDRTILPLTDVICTNENEAEFITNLTLSTIDDFKGAAKMMLDMGPSVAIVTMGSKGAIITQRCADGSIALDTAECPKVQAKDTTGAGDCFCGSLAHFLISEPHGDVVSMVRRAAQIAAISVQRAGAQSSYPSRRELEQTHIL